mmetsp:Transcript_59708/g.96704  ORF Transcript_59708/g.96704 Transcript_59708/m.96704 type:complete len:83 (-) Transcript_59708:2173-2421(-)
MRQVCTSCAMRVAVEAGAASTDLKIRVRVDTERSTWVVTPLGQDQCGWLCLALLLPLASYVWVPFPTSLRTAKHGACQPRRG